MQLAFAHIFADLRTRSSPDLISSALVRRLAQAL